ncbi:hypothetical protein Tco_1259074, partial [Tanacetum coccineum]
DDDDDDTDDEDEEPFEDEDEEEEHLALADTSTITLFPQARKTVRFEPPMSPSMEARIAEYAAAPTPPSPLSPWSSPLPQIPSPPLPVSSPLLPLPPSTIDSPTYVEAPLGYRAAGIRLRASSLSTHHLLHLSPPLPPLPSSLHLPPHVPTSLPLLSSPLLPLPALLFIPPPIDYREDIPEAELPPHKRLCLTALTSRYEVGESSTAAPRPTGGHRVDYGFIGTMDAETRRQRAEEVDYGIRDVWVDPREAIKELAPMTLEEVNARVTELAAVQEKDTHDIYAVIKDTQDRQTQLFQRVDGLVEDLQFHHETALLLDQEALASREAWTHSVGLSSVVHFELQVYKTHTQMQDYWIASQESLTAALIAQVSSLQGQLSAALGQIQALHARD